MFVFAFVLAVGVFMHRTTHNPCFRSLMLRLGHHQPITSAFTKLRATA